MLKKSIGTQLYYDIESLFAECQMKQVIIVLYFNHNKYLKSFNWKCLSDLLKVIESNASTVGAVFDAARKNWW